MASVWTGEVQSKAHRRGQRSVETDLIKFSTLVHCTCCILNKFSRDTALHVPNLILLLPFTPLFHFDVSYST